MATGSLQHSRKALAIALPIAGAFALLAVALGGDALVPRVRAAEVTIDETAQPVGRDMLEKLSTLSQFDALEATSTDSVRAVPAACLNAYLLLGGDFASVARMFDIGGKPTYGNLHRLQDALYQQAERDGVPGIRASATALYDTSDVLSDWSMRGDDELHRVLEPLRLTSERLYGPTRASETQKGERLMNLLTEDSTRVFLVGLALEPESRTLHALPEEGGENHYVLVLWHDNGFEALDSWRPAGSRTRVRWSDETAAAMLFDTRNVIYWLRR
jgi:hypothetical protein